MKKIVLLQPPVLEKDTKREGMSRTKSNASNASVSSTSLAESKAEQN